MRKRVPTVAILLAPLLPAGVAAATPAADVKGPEPIYSAFTLVKAAPGRTQRCGRYQITTATYAGTAVSPDARMAGTARYTSRLVAIKGRPTGIGSGTLTIRDSRGRLRHRTTLTGVLSQGGVVNGLVSGNVYGPNELILANVTIHFDDQLFRATFRIGLADGANTGVAYPAVPRCR
jgi:hypothetical protein